MTPLEAKQFHESRACTEFNFISRYGEADGKEKWKAYCEEEEEAYADCKLEYFEEKYGPEEGKKKYLELNAKKGLTIKKILKRQS